MTNKNIKSTSAKGKAQLPPTPPEQRVSFPLKRVNFIIMAIAAAMIVLGFCLIAGGEPGPNGEFNQAVFSNTRLVIGPTIAFFGFIVMGVGIMWTPKALRTNKDNADGNA